VEEKAKWVFEKLKGTVVLFHSTVGFVAVEIKSESEEMFYDELEHSGCMLSCFGNIISTSVRVC
jgi:hypothetical protein